MKRPILRAALFVLGVVMCHVALWGGHYVHELYGDTWMDFPIVFTSFLWTVAGFFIAMMATYPFGD